MVSSLTKPQVILSGERYSDQLAKVDLEGTSCAIELQNNKLSGDIGGLTMQVLLPQGDYNSISVNGEWLDLHVEDLRTMLFMANVGNSSYRLFRRRQSRSRSSAARHRQCASTITSSVCSPSAAAKAPSPSSRTTSSAPMWKQKTAAFFCYDTRVKGQWNVQSLSGDITMLSKNLPYNLLIHGQRRKRRHRIRQPLLERRRHRYLQRHRLVIASAGNNPDKFIQATSLAGNVSIGQRERYSDLDPYAADYPFADSNPYLIERSTITK